MVPKGNHNPRCEYPVLVDMSGEIIFYIHTECRFFRCAHQYFTLHIPLCLSLSLYIFLRFLSSSDIPVLHKAITSQRILQTGHAMSCFQAAQASSGHAPGNCRATAGGTARSLGTKLCAGGTCRCSETTELRIHPKQISSNHGALRCHATL